LGDRKHHNLEMPHAQLAEVRRLFASETPRTRVSRNPRSAPPARQR